MNMVGNMYFANQNKKILPNETNKFILLIDYVLSVIVCIEKNTKFILLLNQSFF